MFSLPIWIVSTDIAGMYIQFTETKLPYQSQFNEWVTAISQHPSLTQKAPYSVIYSTPTWSFLSVYDQVVHKKRSASIFLNWEIQAQRGNLNKVIESQILNSVHILPKIRWNG